MVVTALRKAARRGFTLVELVIVVLVIGIIAAIAAPKMFDTAGNARTNATQQSLRTLRASVELYKADKGNYPALATIVTDLKPYLTGPFPAPQVGTKQNATVANGGTTQVPIAAPTAGTEGWIYNATTGEIKANEAPYFSW